jgi:hypothetical protein
MSKVLSFFPAAAKVRPLAIILGTNEIASAVAVRLVRARYAVVLCHDPFPPVIRRAMAFHDALFGGATDVDGVAGERASCLADIDAVLAKPGRVAVTPLGLAELAAQRTLAVLIDARMQKRRTAPDLRGAARVAVGLGPKFTVGVNCGVAVETRPAKNGALVDDGATEDADGVSRSLGGAGRERFAYSDRTGLWRTTLEIGAPIAIGAIVGHHDGAPVRAPIGGVLRGVVRDGAFAPEGVKLLEIDPRGREACWAGSDERGRVIAEAALSAILAGSKRTRRSLTAAAANYNAQERA